MEITLDKGGQCRMAWLIRVNLSVYYNSIIKLGNLNMQGYNEFLLCRSVKRSVVFSKYSNLHIARKNLIHLQRH